MAADTALTVDKISKRFGGVTALDTFSCQIVSGTVTGIIGPNGAGKSTLFNAVCGVAPPDSGRIHLYNTDISGWSPRRVARLGLSRTFQLARELGRLTVLENLMLAPLNQLGERLWPVFSAARAVARQDREIYQRALEVLAFAKLASLRDELAENLSGGQKKLLELARTLMLDSRLILLDEPGAGVNPALMQTLAEMIRTLNREHGKTFVIVEHDMDLVAQLCDPVIVMTAGQALTQGNFDAVRRDPRVIDAYLGSPATDQGCGGA